MPYGKGGVYFFLTTVVTVLPVNVLMPLVTDRRPE
jgi:hypothetical protein